METDLQSLLEKIKKEGIEEGKKQSSSIVHEAEKRLQRLLMHKVFSLNDCVGTEEAKSSNDPGSSSSWGHANC